MSETEAFKEIFGETIRSAMREVLCEQKPQKKEATIERLYTRDYVCEKLDICKATFHNWKNAGVFKTKKVGRRVYIFADKFDDDFAEEKFQKFHIKPQRFK